MTPVTSMVVSKPGSEELAFLQEDASDLLDETGERTSRHVETPLLIRILITLNSDRLFSNIRTFSPFSQRMLFVASGIL